MHSVILTPREHHNATTLEAYRRRQAQAIARRVRFGARVALHRVETPLDARIDHGSWVVDCECGAGNACDPAWPVALCFGCGAEHPVRFPAETAEVERLMLARRHMRERNWHPRESVAAVKRLNRKNGVTS